MNNDEQFAEMLGKDVQLFRKNKANIDFEKVNYDFVKLHDTAEYGDPEEQIDYFPANFVVQNESDELTGKTVVWVCVTAGCPILDRGLRLVRDGLEPDYVETILLNTAISNNIDLLTALVVMEGVYAIQTVQSPYKTRELLKAYFTFEFEKEFDSGVNKSEIKLNDV